MMRDVDRLESTMQIYEIDWRIEPLHDVVLGIDAGLAAIHQRLDTEEGF